MPTLGDAYVWNSVSGNTFLSESSFNIGALTNSSPNGFTTTTNNVAGYSQENAAGNATYNLIELNSNNGLHFDQNRVCTYVASGGSATAHSGSSVLAMNGAGYYNESYSFGTDMKNIGTDFQNTFQIGCLDGNNASELGDFIITVQSNQRIQLQINGIQVAATVGNRLTIPAGGAYPPGSYLNSVENAVPASLGGPILDILVDVPTASTSAFTTLLTLGTPPNIFQNVGDKIVGHLKFTCITVATATREIKLLFGTVGSETTIFDSGAVTTVTNGVVTLDFTLMYTAAGVVEYDVTVDWKGAASTVYSVAGSVGSLTLSNINNLLVEAEPTGTNATAADIILKKGSYIQWLPAAVVNASPKNLAPLFWLKADGGNCWQNNNRGTVCSSNGQNVALMIDSSGNDLHWWQTSSFWPTYQTNIQNGLPGVLFNGSSQFLFQLFNSSLNINASTGIPQPFSIYVVAKVLANPTGNKGIIVGSDGGNQFGLQYNSSVGGLVVYAGTNLHGTNTNMSLNTTYTIEGIFNGASSAGSINGGTQTTGNAGSGAMMSLIAGQAEAVPAAGGGTQFTNMYLFEVLAFNRVLSVADESTVFAYLRAKWGHY